MIDEQISFSSGPSLSFTNLRSGRLESEFEGDLWISREFDSGDIVATFIDWALASGGFCSVVSTFVSVMVAIFLVALSTSRSSRALEFLVLINLPSFSVSSLLSLSCKLDIGGRKISNGKQTTFDVFL